jgi:hypothetical protein
VCTNLKTDPSNCSKCGGACSAPPNGEPFCKDAKCDFRCLDGLQKCEGQCLDFSSDNRNCGHCRTVCQAPDGGFAACVDGHCDEMCLVGFSLCDHECVNMLLDPKHCGDCGKHCSGDALCVAGQCIGADGQTESGGAPTSSRHRHRLRP